MMACTGGMRCHCSVRAGRRGGPGSNLNRAGAAAALCTQGQLHDHDVRPTCAVDFSLLCAGAHDSGWRPPAGDSDSNRPGAIMMPRPFALRLWHSNFQLDSIQVQVHSQPQALSRAEGSVASRPVAAAAAARWSLACNTAHVS